MQEIKRHATYYTDRAKQNCWCQGCFHHLADDQPIMLDDGTEAIKSELQECKNDALPEEGWVNCDHCNSWVHQICSLFNGRVNKTGARYTCPNCYLSKGSVGRAFSKQIKVAADLPHCKMSEAIESGLLAALEKAYTDRSIEFGLSIDNVEKAESLSIRVVSNTEKRHLVGEEVR
jgi:E1A/CREB-binding protein